MNQTESAGKPGVELSLVCPCFNEQDTLEAFFRALDVAIREMGVTHEILCVNDGSSDGTLEVLKRSKARNAAIRIINLSRNFGKEAALSAGIDLARGRWVVPIDVDLQDPPELIPRMLEKAREGYDVVLAKRASRLSDTLTKRITADWFYRVHNLISPVPITENAGDFRLLSRRVVDAIRSLPETQRFMKGIFAWVGFRTAVIEYSRSVRHAGNSKFSAWRLWNFALDGITSFSTVPLRIWTYVGAVVAVAAFFYGSIIVVRTLLFGVDTPGYASLLTSILFLGGVQLMSIGTLGEYIGRVYLEVKRRPLYVIESEL